MTVPLWIKTVVDQDCEKVGDVPQIYFDDRTNQPTWATVSTGLFGTKETFVPLDQAQVTSDAIMIPFTESFMKDAPDSRQ